MKKSGVFAPIIILTLSVISAATVVVTKRQDDAFLCYMAMSAAGVMLFFTCLCYVYILLKKEELFRSDEYAIQCLAFKSADKKVVPVRSNKKDSQGRASTKKGGS